MQHSHRMDGLERAGNLPQKPQRRERRERLFEHALAQIARREMLHRDISMIVGNAKIINAHDVLVIQARDDFIFLQESIEADETLRHVGNLAEHFQHHQRSRAFALGKIDLAHAAAADLPDASMAADDHGAEAITILVVRIGAQQRESLAVLVRGRDDHLEQPVAIDLAAVEPRARRWSRAAEIPGYLRAAAR